MAFPSVERLTNDVTFAEEHWEYKFVFLETRKIRIVMDKRKKYILAPPLPPKIMLVWRSSAGSPLPTDATIVSISNWEAETSLVR